MNDKKRKTTSSQNSILKPIEETKKTTNKVNARDARTSKKSKSSEKSDSLGELSKWKLISRERTDQDRALDMFMKEYKAKYFKKHPDATRMLYEERRVGQLRFLERVKKEKSEFVNKYLKKYKDAQAEYRRLEEEFRMGKLKIEDARKNAGWACSLSPSKIV